MTEKTEYLDLYKWNKEDTKQETITEMANNSHKLDVKFRNQDIKIDDIDTGLNELDRTFNELGPVLEESIVSAAEAKRKSELAIQEAIDANATASQAITTATQAETKADQAIVGAEYVEDKKPLIEQSILDAAAANSKSDVASIMAQRAEEKADRVERDLDSVVNRETDSDAMSRQASINADGVDKQNLKIRLDDDYNKVTQQLADTLDKVSGVVNVVEFGAATTKTKLENKQAIQRAIVFVDSLGGGQIVIPYNIEYGYMRNNISTHPDTSATTTDIIINDFSKGSSYLEGSRDGAQVRTFLSTSGIENDGMHDGATFWQRAKWHPAYFISNDGGTGTSANRRATLFFANNGVATWGVGQGNNSVIPNGTDQDAHLSAFKIVANGLSDLGVVGLTTMFTILKNNGYFGFNTANPAAEFHFAARSSGDFLLSRGGGGSPSFQLKTDTFTSQMSLLGDLIQFSEKGKNAVFTFKKDGSEFNLRRVTDGNLPVFLKTASKNRRVELVDSTGDIRITNSALTTNVFTLTDAGNAKFSAGVNGGLFTTANRPTGVTAGTMVIDSDLGKIIWWTGTVWKDAMGTVV